MLNGIDSNQRIEIELNADKSDPKTIFVVRPLSGLEMLRFSSGSESDIENMIFSSIVEIKNFTPGLSTEQAIRTLNIVCIGELIKKINAINQITEQDQKN